MARVRSLAATGRLIAADDRHRSDHRYEVEFIGLVAPINAQFHDSDGGNNAEALTLVVLGPPAWPAVLLHHEA